MTSPVGYNTRSPASDSVTFSYPSWSSSETKTETLDIESGTSMSYVPVSESSWRREPINEVSFNKVKQDRLIKMTPLSVGSIKTRKFLLAFPHEDRKRVWAAAKEHTIEDGERQCKSYFSGFHDLSVSYTDYEDYDLALRNRPSRPFYGVPITQGFQSELNDISGRVVSDLNRQLDVLTELAEGPSTLKFLIGILRTAMNPIRGIKDIIRRYNRARARGKAHLEVLDDLSQEWLQYRYAIMPLIFSVKDGLELLDKQGTEFKTSRARDSLDLNVSRKADASSDLKAFYQEVHGSIDVSAVGKMRYDSASLRLADQISINPFLTAWELVPFSFVIDWFLNVGEVLLAHTSMLGSLAVSTKYCRSVRKRITRTTYYKTSYTDSATRSADVYMDACGNVVRPALSWNWEKPHSEVYLCQKEDFDTYDRYLFNPSDVRLSFSPSLSWMRELDSIALTLRKLLS